MSSSNIPSFADFGIVPKRDNFVGDKIRIMKILNQPIIVHAFKMSESKYADSSDVMHLQLVFRNEMRVLFTASKILAEQISKVPEDKFPFSATICKEGESFIFK